MCEYELISSFLTIQLSAGVIVQQETQLYSLLLKVSSSTKNTLLLKVSFSNKEYYNEEKRHCHRNTREI